MKIPPDHITEIERLIDRYFEATATASEEATLRRILADPKTEPTPTVEEARAVMWFTALLRPRKPKIMRLKTVRIISVAASLALLISIFAYFLTGNAGSSQENGAIIYCQGIESHSTEDALALMRSQLGSVGRERAEGEAAAIFQALNETIEK